MPIDLCLQSNNGKSRTCLNSKVESRSEGYTKLLYRLFEKPYKFHTLRIVAAYWDVPSIEELINWATSRSVKDRRDVIFKLFLNKPKHNKVEELSKLNKKIKRKFKDLNNGIYIVEGAFVHVKAFQVEGVTKGILSVGSNNLTENASSQFDEALIRVEYDPRKPYSNGMKTKRKFEVYLDEMFSKNATRRLVAQRFDDWKREIPKRKAESLSDYLLNYGELWMEFKTSTPYQLPLQLPKDLLEELRLSPAGSENLAERLGKNIPNSSNTESLIRDCRNRNNLVESHYKSYVASKSAKNGSTGKNCYWKDYVIETSLGYWAPAEWHCCISKELLKKEALVIKHEANLNLLLKFEEAVTSEFFVTVRLVLDQLHNSPAIRIESNSPWYLCDDCRNRVSYECPKSCKTKIKVRWQERWKKHVQKLKNKLRDKRYREWLAVGIRPNDVPNMRLDDPACKVFLDSFIDAFEFHSVQKGTRRRLVKKGNVKRWVDEWQGC